MIECRPFLNCDPPAIQEIWNRQPPCRGLLQPMTPAVFDQLVLSKPYFDRHGLLLAVEDGVPVGCVHAGFGPAEDRTALDRRRGIICLLLVAPHPQQTEIARQLLTRGEDYLRRQGAGQVFGGCLRGINPFYLGLYGGCGSPGVLTADALAMRTFAAAGYAVDERRGVYQRDLADFRAPIDRQLVELKRKSLFDLVRDPPPADWWESCLYAPLERMRGSLVPRGGTAPWATADFWDIEPLASSWGAHAVGFLRLQIHDGANVPDASILATHVVAESLRAVQSHGVTLAEMQIETREQPFIDICLRLGFAEVAQGVAFRKEI